jgi:ribosomal protein S1
MKNKNIIFGYILGFLLLIFLIWTYKTNQEEKRLLNNKGIKTKGVITKIMDRKRGIDFKYRFLYKNIPYESWGKTYKRIEIGDTIIIIFYPKNPLISKSIIQ